MISTGTIDTQAGHHPTHRGDSTPGHTHHLLDPHSVAMSFGTLFSAVVKPDKPLLYLCDESTHITNVALCPVPNNKKSASDLKTIPPFVTILKLQYEGPVLEGEQDDEDDDDKENVNVNQPNGVKSGKKPTQKKATEDDDDDDEDEDEDEDSDYDELDLEEKEVVIGCFTPNTLQLTTDIYLAPQDQYRFVLSGSADYEVHLLGRYIPDMHDQPPSDLDSEEEDFDDSMGDLYPDAISTDEEESDGPRITELEDEDEKVTQASKATKPKANPPAPTKDEAKPTSKLTEDKKSNKRPLEEKETEADVSMADSAVGSTTDENGKLSKSQKKKLKKLKLAEKSTKKDTHEASKPTDGGKVSEAKDAANAPTKQSNLPSTVTLPSGLKIVDTKLGVGAEAKPGQSVSMRYIGKLANGKVFDSNTKGKPFVFHLGRGEVIKGWDEGIKGMKVGGERKLTIPANLAYGKSGAPPDIPPNSALSFEVKLLTIK